MTYETECELNLNPPKILNKYAEDISSEELQFIESPQFDRIELIWEPIIDNCGEKVYDIKYCHVSNLFNNIRTRVLIVTQHSYAIRSKVRMSIFQQPMLFVPKFGK